MQSNKHKLFNHYTLITILAGIAINYAGKNLTLLLGLPLFLDSIGTIFTAMLGGYLPGIVVGFFSNVLNSAADPISLYYGIVSVLLAIAAAYLSKKGYFKKPWKTIICILVFTFIGGGIGSVLTWLLYGFNFGTGVSAPFAVFINDTVIADKFTAQFVADMAIDLLDKTITVGVVVLSTRFLPDKYYEKLPIGFIYQKKPACDTPFKPGKEKSKQSRFSLPAKITGLIIITATILGLLSITIGFILYKDTMEDKYSSICTSAVNLMINEIDGDSIDGFLAADTETEEYLAVKESLEKIRKAIPDVEYIYVYKILEDGCQVVFDLDTPTVSGDKRASIVEFDESFENILPQLYSGSEIAPVITDGQYGWLLSVYKPIKNSNGDCVAYAAADISMTYVMTDRYIYVIRMVSLLFGASIIIIAFAIWFAQRKIAKPIDVIADAASKFAFDDTDSIKQNTKTFQSLDIHTGDEIENLYNAMSKVVADVGDYITLIDRKNAALKKKSAIISQMQENIIISFANMVEDRDETTGGHIRRTAKYVNILCLRLQKDGLNLSDKSIENITRSAPLHDIGKIKIPDSILNKPGRLTNEEFDIIKTHTTEGERILQDVLADLEDDGYLSQAINMATYHHERWDGKGYPSGLSGENIPICARIMAVADVFDALVSERSYKKAFSFDEAMAIIADEKGKQFDPQVVDAFIDESAQIKKICETE